MRWRERILISESEVRIVIVIGCEQTKLDTNAFFELISSVALGVDRMMAKTAKSSHNTYHQGKAPELAV